MMFDGKLTREIPKQKEIDNGSFYSSGCGAASTSDLGSASSSKSPFSASINSSSNAFNFPYSKDPVKEKQMARVEEDRTGEPVIGLKLGQRTYFEDVCGGAGGSVKPSSFTPSPAEKKSRASCQSSMTPRCQVEGCNLDLSSVKDYYRRNRVCESHSKFPRVVVAGLERRFCQKCSRFHGLLEFDENKRSCRRRLSDHNARRRKPQPQPDPIQHSSGGMSLSLYDAREQTSLLFNSVPLAHTRRAAKPTWETITEVLRQGLEAASDLPRALSLLSNNPWGSGNTESYSVNHLMNTNHTSMADSTVHAVPQGLPEYWQTEHEPDGSQLHALAGANQFQEFQQFKAPFESGFYSGQIN